MRIWSKLPSFQIKKNGLPLSQGKPVDFYQASADWVYDMYQSQSVWLKRALFALVILSSFLLMSLLLNLFLFPLKERVPYLYAFNNATGEITKIGQLEPTKLSADWQVTRYFLIHYVINRESYDYDNLDYPYQLAWAMSADKVRQQYDALVSSDSLNSPYRTYGKDKFITVRVISVNRLSEDTADVRFEKTLHDRNSGTQQVSQQEAIIKWQYQQAETTQKMLDRDPLGFKVTYYQVSQVSIDNNF